MKELSIYSLTLIISLFVLACQPQTEQSAEAATDKGVPELIDRSQALWQGKEWENVQNYYVEYREKLAKNNQDHEARLALAQLFINEARVTGEHGHYYPAALEMIAGIDAKTADEDVRFRALSTKAGVQLSLHDFADALETAEQAVAINPYNAQIYGALVDANVEMGRYETAVAMADKMVAIRPDLRSYARVSYLREIHGDIDGAIAAMKLAVEAGYPGYEQTAWTRLTLGNLYERYGDLEQAKLQYKIVLSERESYPFAIGALADLAIEQGEYEKAEQLLEQACAIIPEFGFYASLARVYKATGREDAFEETLEELWVMLKEDTDSGHNMDMEYAELYSELAEDQEKALAYAKKAYDKRPENIDVNRLMGKIYKRMGKDDMAMEHLARASRTNAQYPELKALLASRSEG